MKKEKLQIANGGGQNKLKFCLNNKKKLRMVLCAILLIVVVGVSYAFINLTLEGTKKQVITAGILSLELDEDENNLTIENALPMYDEVGMIQDAFTFRLTNNSTIPSAYTMSLMDITLETVEKLDTSIVKYGLVKDGVSEIELLSELDNGVIDFGVIDKNQTIEYELRFWIDSSVTENSVITGKSLSYKIGIEATQAEGAKYKVYFDSGTDINIEPIVYTYGETYNTLPTVTKENYIFQGWYTSDGELITETSTVDVLTKNTLYAKFNPITYTIVYNSNGGSGTTVSSTHEYDNKQALAANNFTKPGYTFSGWNTESNGSGTSYTNSEEIINLTTENESTINLYAQWIANTYTVVYNGNGATSGSMTNSSHTYDVAKTLTTNSYSRNSHTFTGWNTKSDGTGTSYSNGASVKNLTTENNATVTLYAQWNIATTVTAVPWSTVKTSYKSTITEVEFLDSIPNLSSYSKVWNVTQSFASETIAYLDGTKLYIASDGGVISTAESCKEMFRDFTKVTSIKFNDNFDTSNATDMYYMFYNCTSLKSLDVSSFNTSKVTNLHGTFAACTALSTLDLSSWDVSNVTKMQGTFASSTGLIILDLRNWNTAQTSNMIAMFSRCSKLQYIYVTYGMWSTSLAASSTVYYDYDDTYRNGLYGTFGDSGITVTYK